MYEQSTFDSLTAGLGLGAILFIALLALIPAFFYYFTLQKTMNAVSERNRAFAGGLVWLSLVPVLGTVWFCVYAILLSSSLKKDLAERRLPGDGGLSLTIGFVISLVLLMIPFINLIALITAIVLWIIHWVKMAEYRRVIDGTPGSANPALPG
ncbi:hypothetical protein [Crenobacter cavernae]|uniref:DUF4234 domain-containing protein n=1 Tax=Crenobacter cavernae TaxID=2290923 RepID=A0ABY0FCY5_9NEIS|nr:hypothetical protein [Crenobacter cavernae]RXZ44012.1 hypothetical protein EBB06_07545 [Crenobacter cavernae]